MLRVKAGIGQLVVSADHIEAALAAAERQAQELAGLLLQQGKLAPAYRICLNGVDFIDDLAHPLAPSDAVLLISADPGG